MEIISYVVSYGHLTATVYYCEFPQVPELQNNYLATSTN
jgi:hypothetical protein